MAKPRKTPDREWYEKLAAKLQAHSEATAEMAKVLRHRMEVGASLPCTAEMWTVYGQITKSSEYMWSASKWVMRHVERYETSQEEE